MIGGESESGSGDDSAKAGRASVAEAKTLRRALAKQGHQHAAAAGSIPATDLSSAPLHDSSEAAAWSNRTQRPTGVSGRHELHPATLHTAEDSSVGGSARHSLRHESMEPAQAGHKGKSRAEGHLGRKQKRGKKGKPQSQLQLMQAQIQAQKASAARAFPILKHIMLAEFVFDYWHHRDVSRNRFLCTWSQSDTALVIPSASQHMCHLTSCNQKS